MSTDRMERNASPDDVKARRWRPPIWMMVAALLALAGPLFGPIPRWLDDRFDLDVAVLVLVGLFTAVFGLLAASVVVLRARRWGWHGAFRDLGLLHSGGRWPLFAGAALGLIWGLLGKFGIYQYVDEPDFSLTALGAGTALLAVIVGVTEDIVTRSYLMNSQAEAGRSKRSQVGLSALLFATYHSAWFGTADLIGVFVFSFVYGALLAGLFVCGNRSLWPVILGHSGALLVGEPQLTETLFRSVQ